MTTQRLSIAIEVAAHEAQERAAELCRLTGLAVSIEEVHPMEDELEVDCYFCGSPCIEDDFCEGCKVYVCTTCDGAPTWIAIDGPRHGVYVHCYRELKTVEARVRQVVEAYTAH